MTVPLLVLVVSVKVSETLCHQGFVILIGTVLVWAFNAAVLLRSDRKLARGDIGMTISCSHIPVL